VDELESEAPRLARRQRQVHRLTADDQRSPVRRVETSEALDDRRLARSVLAKQSMDLSGSDAQFGATERLDPAETLGDASEVENVRVGH